MANWFYYDATGTKFGPVESATLKALARHGVIRPETVIENDAGKRGHAGAILGLEFASVISPPFPPSSPSPPAPPVNHDNMNTSPPPTNSPVVESTSAASSPSGVLLVLKSTSGGILEVYEDKAVITRKGISDFFIYGLKGNKSFFYSKMSGVQFKKCGFALGYFQFVISGSKESKGGVWAAQRDENSIAFYASQNERAEAIRDYIESRIAGHPSDPSKYFRFFDVHEKSKKSPWGLTLKIAGGFLLFCFIFSFLLPIDEATKKERERVRQEKAKAAQSEKKFSEYDMKASAEIYAEILVKEYLKYPLDAKFNWDKKTEKKYVDSIRDTGWIVTGTVKAPNGFGAVITHSYRVVITGLPDNPKKVSVEIDDKFVYMNTGIISR